LSAPILKHLYGFLKPRSIRKSGGQNKPFILKKSTQIAQINTDVIPAPAFAGVNLSPRKRGAGIQFFISAESASIIILVANSVIKFVKDVEKGVFIGI
jgi:hypothetical protein